jgi:hypothetical protein
VSVILALLLTQAPAFTGTVPQPNAALDAAHASLRAGLAERLAENAPSPNAEERWGWAVTIADRCEAQINAAADSKDAVLWVDSHAQTTITKRQMLKAEANHFVDRLIREHYEAQA